MSEDLAVPYGLCGNRDDHEPHWHNSASLGPFWCHADQSQRLPYAAERRRADVSFAPALGAYRRDGGESIAARQEEQ